MYYEYYISYPFTPAFSDNIDLMISQILNNGGSTPNATRVTGTNSFNNQPLKGTKQTAGRQMMYFKLPVRMDETEAKVFLEATMIDPKPPITIKYIRSEDNFIQTVIGQDIEGDDLYRYDYDIVFEQNNKLNFTRYVTGIPDGGTDINGFPTTRDAVNSDNFSLSHYLEGIGHTPVSF